MNRSQKNLSVIVYIAVALVLALAVGMVVQFINNGQKNFYVQFANEQISTSKENVRIEKGSYSVFYCKNITDVLSKNKNDYTLKIVPNPKITDFDIVLNDEILAFNQIENFTSAFNIVQNSDFFSIYIPQNETMKNIFVKILGESVEIPQQNNYGSVDYFNLVVTNAKNDVVTISFTINALT